MKVRCTWQAIGAQNDGSAIAGYLRYSDWGASLDSMIQLGPIELDDINELVIVGGRNSIRQAFGTLPVANHKFLGSSGRLLYMSDRQHRPAGKTTVAMAVATNVAGPFINPVMGVGNASFNGARITPKYGVKAGLSHGVRSYGNALQKTYDPRETYHRMNLTAKASKEITVLRLFSDTDGCPGIQLGPSVNGASIAVTLAGHWGI